MTGVCKLTSATWCIQFSFWQRHSASRTSLGAQRPNEMLNTPHPAWRLEQNIQLSSVHRSSPCVFCYLVLYFPENDTYMLGSRSTSLLKTDCINCTSSSSGWDSFLGLSSTTTVLSWGGEERLEGMCGVAETTFACSRGPDWESVQRFPI